MMAMPVGTDGMITRINGITAVVAVDQGSRMRRFEFDGAGRRIDSRDQDEHRNEQREERHQYAVPVRRSNHAALYHGSVPKQCA